MRATIVRRQLLAGTVALLAFRLFLTFLRTGPLVVADEVGYLTNARVLAGGVAGQMSTAPFYRGGYSLLIAPLIALDSDARVEYRLALVLNVLLAASIAPLLYMLLTRCFHATPRQAVWPALAAAAYPSVTLFSQVALSENLLFPLTILWLLCFGASLEASGQRRQFVAASALGFSTVALYAVHGRMIVAVALTALGVIFLTLRRRFFARSAIVALLVMGVGAAGVRRLDDFLISRSYGGQHPNEVGQRLSSLHDLTGILAVMRNVVGQTWYLMVATLGVVVLFVFTGGLRSLAGIHRRDSESAELVFALLVATALGLLFVSALSFPNIERADMLIYGRYVEVVVPPLLAIALVRLRPLVWNRRVAMALGLLGLATVVVVATRAGVHPSGGPNRWNIASLPFLTLSLGTLSLIGAGAVAVGALIVLVAIARRALTRIAPAVLVLFLPTTAVIVHNPDLSAQRSFYPHNWTSPAAATRGTDVVAFDVDHHDSLYVDQWFITAHLVLFSGTHDEPPSRYVISTPAWAQQHRSLRPRMLWFDPAHNHGLFRLRPAE